MGALLSGVEGGESMLTQREAPSEFSLLEDGGERHTLAGSSATGGFELGDPASPSTSFPVKLTAEATGEASSPLPGSQERLPRKLLLFPPSGRLSALPRETSTRLGHAQADIPASTQFRGFFFFSCERSDSTSAAWHECIPELK